MLEYYVGIDGGGTKTDFALADKKGSIIGRIVLGASNPNDVGIRKTLSVLDEGINALCASLPKENISVFAGLAGTSGADFSSDVCNFLKSCGFGKIGNGIDAENAVAAAIGKRNGIVVIMGTGSIALTQRDGELFRTGGFGYLFDDEGSGFELGKDAILASLKDESGYGEKTLITVAVKAKCGRDTILNAVSDFYLGGKKYIAEFAPTVFDAYDNGDTVAERIIRKNMSGIAELIICASQHLCDETVEVGLCGGITNRAEIILPFIKEALGGNAEKYRLCVCRKPQVYGALVLAGIGSCS